MGSKPVQPAPGTNTDTQACEASEPRYCDPLLQITAHITGRQAHGTQRADHDVGEILADAAVGWALHGKRRSPPTLDTVYDMILYTM